MKVYCDKHKVHDRKIQILMVPIKSEDHLMLYYCPLCNLEYWTRDCLTFYLTKAEVKEL
jgi:hypothetical protein